MSQRILERVQLPADLAEKHGYKTLKVLDSAELHKAFAAGRTAKQRGFERVEPYYECDPLNHFWLAGYDGKKFEEAQNG